MPLLNVKVIENVFTDEQKKQMVEGLTDAMVSIEGENMRGVTWVVVEEVRSGQWGIGGNALTTEDVKALASGVPVGWPGSTFRVDLGRSVGRWWGSPRGGPCLVR